MIALVQPDPLLKELTCEFLIDSLTCKTQSVGRSEVVDVKTLFCRLHYSAISEIKIHCSSEDVQVDFDYLMQIFDRLKQEAGVESTKKPNPIDVSGSGQSQSVSTTSINSRPNLNVTQISVNLKTTSIITEGIKISVVKGNVDSDLGKLGIFFTDLDVETLYPMVKDVVNEVGLKVMHLKQAKWIFDRDSNERSITIEEEIYFQWNIQFHLSACNFFKRIHLLRQLKEQPSGESSKKSSAAVKTHINFDGDINVGALLSTAGHLVEFCGKNFKSTLQSTVKSFVSDCVNILFDHHQVGRFEKARLTTYPDNESRWMKQLLCLDAIGLTKHPRRDDLKRIMVEIHGNNFEIPPTDPTVYRLKEIVQVYGAAIKALIHEEFGDGRMSAVNLGIDLQKEVRGSDERVVITRNGKFLKYKKW